VVSPPTLTIAQSLAVPTCLGGVGALALPPQQ
jgi:hypothetical protein